jgi:hypothetical protein
MVTNKEVFITTEIYKGYLPTDIRQHLAFTNQLCSLGNYKYIFYSQSDVNIVYFNASIDDNINNLQYFMVREDL